MPSHLFFVSFVQQVVPPPESHAPKSTHDGALSTISTLTTSLRMDPKSITPFHPRGVPVFRFRSFVLLALLALLSVRDGGDSNGDGDEGDADVVMVMEVTEM